MASVFGGLFCFSLTYLVADEKEDTPTGFYIKNDSLFLYPAPNDTYSVNVEYLTLAIGEDDFGDSC